MTRLIDADALRATIMSKKNDMVDLWDFAFVLNAINKAPTVEEKPKDDDLCETCRYGNTCGQSDKGVSFAKHSKCWKYRYEETDNDKV